jgi:hypothetical protein
MMVETGREGAISLGRIDLSGKTLDSSKRGTQMSPYRVMFAFETLYTNLSFARILWPIFDAPEVGPRGAMLVSSQCPCA